jgi:hypothetical protein
MSKRNPEKLDYFESLLKEIDNEPRIQQVFREFYRCEKTILMVTETTRLNRLSVNRYVLKMRGYIRIVGKAPCKISGRMATYYTTHPELIYALKYWEPKDFTNWEKKMAIVKPKPAKP